MNCPAGYKPSSITSLLERFLEGVAFMKALDYPASNGLNSTLRSVVLKSKLNANFLLVLASHT
jgi:hypothetical protein